MTVSTFSTCEITILLQSTSGFSKYISDISYIYSLQHYCHSNNRPVIDDTDLHVKVVYIIISSNGGE